MPNALEFLQGAFRGNGPSGEEVCWEDLEAALLGGRVQPAHPGGRATPPRYHPLRGADPPVPDVGVAPQLVAGRYAQVAGDPGPYEMDGPHLSVGDSRRDAVATSPMLTAVARAVAKEILQTKKRTTAVEMPETISSSATPPNGNQPDVWGRDAQGVQVRQEDAEPPWVRIRLAGAGQGNDVLAGPAHPPEESRVPTRFAALRRDKLSPPKPASHSAQGSPMKPFECNGHWWLPQADANRVAGNLRVSANGDLKLAVFGCARPLRGAQRKQAASLHSWGPSARARWGIQLLWQTASARDFARECLAACCGRTITLREHFRSASGSGVRFCL